MSKSAMPFISYNIELKRTLGEISELRGVQEAIFLHKNSRFIKEGRAHSGDPSRILSTLAYFFTIQGHKCEKITIASKTRIAFIHLCENGYLILITDSTVNLPLFAFIIPRAIYQIENIRDDDSGDVYERIRLRIDREVANGIVRLKNMSVVPNRDSLSARVEIDLLGDDLECDPLLLRKRIATIIDEEAPLFYRIENEVVFLKKSSQFMRITRRQILQMIERVRGI